MNVGEKTKTWMALLAMGATLLAGCGDDGDGGEDAAADAAPASEVECEPVGDGGGTPVTATLTEWAIMVDPGAVPAGEVTFDVENDGGEPHELVVVQADSPDDLTIVDGRVDEEALPDGAFIGEVESFPAGESCDGTFDLEPGNYVLFCNLLEEEDGMPESHVEEGMVTTFEVT